MAKKKFISKTPYCEARKYVDNQAICHHSSKACVYLGESPGYNCPIYPSYEKFKLECERFFDWRRRVNGQRW